MSQQNNSIISHAVITGDVVESSQIESAQLNKALKEAFENIQKSTRQDKNVPGFDIFRGDSFQGLLSNASDAVKAAILIRATLRKNQPGEQEHNWDARIAIGIGSIDYLPQKASEGDGTAYQNSGPVLDKLKGDYKCAVQTPYKNINNECKALCALLDAVIAKWTANQAEIIVMLLQNMTPKKISEKLDISQTAVHYRVKGAGWFAIKELLKRYKQIINNKRKE